MLETSKKHSPFSFQDTLRTLVRDINRDVGDNFRMLVTEFRS